MRFYAAPMEGVTGCLYRKTHHEFFGGIDRYYIPFLEPRERTVFDGRDRREIQPEENAGIPTVPQMLTNRADRFLEGARRLADLGYQEVNLNLGCPARTVVSRKRGSGCLADTDRLALFLDEIFEASPLPISIKTRLGVWEQEEFAELLSIYRRYPMTELIIHARIQTDQYKGAVRWDAFREALDNPPWPVCYNGDIFSPDAYARFREAFPQVERIMLGRGLIANPGLGWQLQTGEAVTGEKLCAFHDALLSRYRELLFGERSVLCWMKELWFYLSCLYPQAEKEYKRIRKAQHLSDYESAAHRIFETYAPATEPGYCR